MVIIRAKSCVLFVKDREVAFKALLNDLCNIKKVIFLDIHAQDKLKVIAF